jgi:transcriptional regulator GlxA family with amidase domain
LLQDLSSNRPCQPDDQGIVSTAYKAEDAQKKIEQSISYMLEHLDKPIQVSTLAARANISPSHYFVLFKQRTGCPPIDYFIRLRMQRARELLAAGSLHVKEVAAVLGYEDPFYFSRVFKSVNQIAPSKYRLKLMPSGAASNRDISINSFSPLKTGQHSDRINFWGNNLENKTARSGTRPVL